ncbi:hypothetical protein H9P43_009947 [Blastocladiella emersonii ATCC 22665]|nr:hypothetical protein H9P43_009947 [Blastocladiella emersonii ATCC 22665]
METPLYLHLIATLITTTKDSPRPPPMSAAFSKPLLDDPDDAHPQLISDVDVGDFFQQQQQQSKTDMPVPAHTNASPAQVVGGRRRKTSLTSRRTGSRSNSASPPPDTSAADEALLDLISKEAGPHHRAPPSPDSSKLESRYLHNKAMDNHPDHLNMRRTTNAKGQLGKMTPLMQPRQGF